MCGSDLDPSWPTAPYVRAAVVVVAVLALAHVGAPRGATAATLAAPQATPRSTADVLCAAWPQLTAHAASAVVEPSGEVGDGHAVAARSGGADSVTRDVVRGFAAEAAARRGATDGLAAALGAEAATAQRDLRVGDADTQAWVGGELTAAFRSCIHATAAVWRSDGAGARVRSGDAPGASADTPAACNVGHDTAPGRVLACVSASLLKRSGVRVEGVSGGFGGAPSRSGLPARRSAAEKAARAQGRVLQAGTPFASLNADSVRRVAWAEASGRVAVASAPWSWRAHAALGRAVLAQGRHAAGSLAVMRALRLAPQEPALRPLHTDFTRLCFKPPVRQQGAGPAGLAWPQASQFCQHVLETADAALGGAMSQDPILGPARPMLGEAASSAMRSLPRRAAKSVGEVVRVSVPRAALARDAAAKPSLAPAPADHSSADASVAQVNVETLSLAPPVFLAHGFLSPQDCAALRRLALPHLRPGTGHHAATAATLTYLADEPVLKRLAQATAAVTGLKEAYVEQNLELQVLRYPPGGYISAHQDSSSVFAKLVSMFVYLNDVPPGAGGQTLFPYHRPVAPASTAAAADDPGVATDDQADSTPLARPGGDDVGTASTRMALDCRPGLAVQPKLGAAVLWYNHRRDGALDPLATHAGCVLKVPRTTPSASGSSGSQDGSDAGATGVRAPGAPAAVEKWGCNVWVVAGDVDRRHDGGDTYSRGIARGMQAGRGTGTDHGADGAADKYA